VTATVTSTGPDSKIMLVKKNSSGVTQSILNNAQIIKKVKPAVVYIETDTKSGSGMIYKAMSDSSYVLTNAHVVKGFSVANITLSNGASYTGSVVGFNENEDVAVLKIGAGNLPTVQLGNSDILSQGDAVFALGYSFGLSGDAAFTNGIVSKVKVYSGHYRPIGSGPNYIQNTAEIHPGNSGGPLINQYGQVVGITSDSYTDQVVQGITLGETIKLAIPINEVRALIPDLESGSEVLAPTTDQPSSAPTATVQTEQQCQSQGQVAYDQYMSTANGISANDPQVVASLEKIQSAEDELKADNDNEISQIKSEYDPLIQQQEETNRGTEAALMSQLIQGGSLRYAQQSSAGLIDSQKKSDEEAVASIQDEENNAISQQNTLYKSTYARYESLRQNILDSMASAKSNAENVAQSIKEKVYQDCISQN